MFYGIKDYLTENRWYLHILLNLSAQVTLTRVNRSQTERTSRRVNEGKRPGLTKLLSLSTIPWQATAAFTPPSAHTVHKAIMVVNVVS